MFMIIYRPLFFSSTHPIPPLTLLPTTLLTLIAARRDLQATVDVISAEKNAFTKESKMWQTRVDKLIEQKNKTEAEENRKLVRLVCNIFVIIPILFAAYDVNLSIGRLTCNPWFPKVPLPTEEKKINYFYAGCLLRWLKSVFFLFPAMIRRWKNAKITRSKFRIWMKSWNQFGMTCKRGWTTSTPLSLKPPK